MKNKIYILIVIGLLFCLLPFVVNIYWSAADDPRYIFMTSGAYTGIPSGSLLYVGSIYGNIIAWLYKMAPALEWYSVIYYLLFVITVLIFSKALLYSSIPKEMKISLWVILCITHLYMAISPQSTFLASDLSIATIVLIRGKISYTKMIWASVLFFMATQLRLFGALMPYMIVLPIFLLSKSISIGNVKRYILPFVLFFILSSVSFVADALKYNSTTEWSQFKKFDAARCYIADNPLSEKLSKDIHSEEDKLAYVLFQKYRIYDTNVLPVDKMVKYADKMKTYRLENIRNNIVPYAKLYLSFGFLWVFLLILWGGISIVCVKDYKRLMLLLGVCLLFMVANLFMMAQSEAKERALVGALFSCMFAVFVIIGRNVKYQNLTYLFLALGISFQFLSHTKANLNAVTEKINYQKETEEILNNAPYEKVYMPVPSCIDPDMFHSSKSPIAHKTIIQGWMQIFPESDPRYRHLTAFVEGLPILVRKNAENQIDIIRNLLLMHYGMKTTVHILKVSQSYKLLELEMLND